MYDIHCLPQNMTTILRNAYVVSSGKGTGNTNQYTQHKRNVVFLVRGLRDKRENHVTSGIGLVSRSRVSPVYNQEREN